MKKKHSPRNPNVFPAASWLVSETGVLRMRGTATQRAFAALQIEEIEAIEAKKRLITNQGGVDRRPLAKIPEAEKGFARDRAAVQFDISPRYVQDAKKLSVEAPELALKCLRGELNLSEAMHHLKQNSETVPAPALEPKVTMPNLSAGNEERPIYQTEVATDEFTKKASEAFDYAFTGQSTFVGWPVPDLKPFADFQIGLILGPSGSGKSLLLRNFGQEKNLVWDARKAVVSHFSSPAEALDKLMAVGLNSTPSWCRPYHVLSCGEQFRASLARRLESGAVIDEFTSVVDRNVAKAASNALRAYVTRHNLRGLVLATCHSDILSWLRPEWYFDTTDGTLHDGRFLHRPSIQLRIYSCKRTAWGMFKMHHYLTDSLPASTHQFLATADFGNGEVVVGFISAMALGFQLKNAWREARTVVLPDFQGLGIGPRISDAVAQIYRNQGKRYFSKTAHPRFGQYRETHPELWKPTAKNLVRRGADKKAKQKRLASGQTSAGDIAGEVRTDMHNQGLARFDKLCFSHEFIGAPDFNS